MWGWSENKPLRKYTGADVAKMLSQCRPHSLRVTCKALLKSGQEEVLGDSLWAKTDFRYKVTAEDPSKNTVQGLEGLESGVSASHSAWSYIIGTKARRTVLQCVIV